MTRREAREEALILVFEKQFNSDSIEEIIETAKEVRDIQPDEYILNVFNGVYDNLEFIDGIISKYSQGWSINRITKISLAVLRLAVYEMKFIDSIPVSYIALFEWSDITTLNPNLVNNVNHNG